MSDESPSDRRDNGDEQETGDADKSRERRGEHEAPLSDLRERVERQKSTEEASDAEPAFEDLFTEMETEAVEGGELWDELLAAEAESGPVTAGERVDAEVERDVRIIDSRICHRCPHFGDPPELHCTHEGTDILEVMDIGRYKVADCPMVGNEGQDGAPQDGRPVQNDEEASQTTGREGRPDKSG